MYIFPGDLRGNNKIISFYASGFSKGETDAKRAAVSMENTSVDGEERVREKGAAGIKKDYRGEVLKMDERGRRGTVWFRRLLTESWIRGCRREGGYVARWYREVKI